MKTTAGNCFSEDRHGIHYEEGVAPWTSAFIGIFGLMFLVIAVAILFDVAGWPWHGGKVAGLLTVLVFVCFSFAVMLIAIAGCQPQRLHFEAEKRRVHGRVRGRFWQLGSIDDSFDSLRDPVINSMSREMDTNLYEVRVARAGQQPLALGSFETQAEAEHWRGRLDRILKK